ncbi:MAG: dihydrodipicolinate synthase family protein [Bryobacterales bacterium]|nr:dihydrodipicolinate synthase family protein [Bryobacterales bacterium]
MTLQIDGIVPIIPTPFEENEEIAWEDLDRLVDFAVASGACAICLPAYASEFYKLSEEERLGVVRRAVARAAGRLPVIAQVNYPSVKLAVMAAARAREAGASAICSAAPRLFPMPESDLLAYFGGLLESVPLPFVLQDFNPGGPSLSVSALARLHRDHPHFRYVKLEEPLMGAKVTAILEATEGGLGVLEGWGGMYTLELVPVGIAGVAPGLALTDLLGRVFRLAREGCGEQARPLFEGILPQILYSLQNMELFHYAEKQLLKARGVLRNTTVRKAALTPGPHEREHIARLNSRVLELVRTLEDFAHA